METKIIFAKVKMGARIPTKRNEDAGFDIYPCFEDDYMVIKPHETKMIATGIASRCSEDYCFVLKERGSTGTKGIAQRCGIIDSNYNGEWFVPVTNTTDQYLIIYKSYINPDEIQTITKKKVAYPYDKAITQALIIPVPKVDVEEVTYEELLAVPTNRGDGCLGSSGK